MPERSMEVRFDTRAEYQRAIDAVLASAQAEISLFDPDLKNPELDRQARAEALAGFLAGGRDRRLRIVLHDTDHFTRRCPRLMVLVERFSHCLSIRQTPDHLRQLADCFMLGDDANVVVRFHADRFRGKLLLGMPAQVHDWRRRFEDLWQESVPAVSATQLGL